MTYDEYCDITFFELTFLLQGHNDREEERIWPIRRLYALIYNVNVKQGKGKDETELWPFASEKKLIKIKEKIKADQELKQYFNPDRDKVKYSKR